MYLLLTLIGWAIDMMIDQIQRFDVDDIEWDAEVMGGRNEIQ